LNVKAPVGRQVSLDAAGPAPCACRRLRSRALREAAGMAINPTKTTEAMVPHTQSMGALLVAATSACKFPIEAMLVAGPYRLPPDATGSF
jgi:hypothetical protein